MGEKLALRLLPTPALRVALATRPAQQANWPSGHASWGKQRRGSVTQVSKEEK